MNNLLIHKLFESSESSLNLTLPIKKKISIKFIPDLVIEEQIALAFHDITERSVDDDVIIAFKPLIAI